jgi:hypothetical protein
MHPTYKTRSRQTPMTVMEVVADALGQMMVEHKQHMDSYLNKFKAVCAVFVFAFLLIVLLTFADMLERQKRIWEAWLTRFIQIIGEAKNSAAQSSSAQKRAEDDTLFQAGSGFYTCDYRKPPPTAGKTGRPCTPARCAAAAEQRAAAARRDALSIDS